MLAGAVALAFAFPALLGFHTYFLFVAAECVVFAIVAIGLDLLMGRSGQISLGQSGFFAIGAYTAAIVNARYNLDYSLAILAAMALAALAGLVLGFPATRLRGHYLGIVTLGFGVAIAQIALKWTALTNGDEGVHLHLPSFLGLGLVDPARVYYAALIALVVAITFVRTVERTKLGRAFEAVRDSEIAATAMGISVPRTKMIAFVLSAGLTGGAGSLFALLNGFVAPEDFGISQTLLFFAMVIVGGMASVPGAIAGAVVVTLVSQIAATISGLSLTLVGGTIVVVALFFPGGFKAVLGRIARWAQVA